MRNCRATHCIGLMTVLSAWGAAYAEPAAKAEATAPQPASVSLSGEWSLRLDPENVGMKESWQGKSLPDKIRLPGSTDEGGFGKPNTRPADYNYLSRKVEYTGPAWYQREIDIPAEWQGRRITLFLERCHWETRAWLDEAELGMQDSLCVPHVYELPAVAPGRHRLTIRIDNTKKYDVGSDIAHSVSEQTQTNWNGIIGRIELRATDLIWVDDVQVYPDPDDKSATVRLTLGNATAGPVQGSIVLRLAYQNGPEAVLTQDFESADPQWTSEAVIKISKVRPWDEFSPSMCELNIEISGKDRNGKTHSDVRQQRFAFRKLSTEGRQLKLNNRNLFLRGTLECCIFPLTGYPPMDVDGWLRILKICQSYGLNHMRFHSWCPPEAAFEAADQMGFLFHVEAPQWVFDVGRDAPRDAFIEDEVKRILRVYGNHPSFGMLCMGNELKGDAAAFEKLVNLAKGLDERHLYTQSTAWSFGQFDDYNVAVIRGLHGPTTDFDFREADAKSKVPLISHEIGQWTFYPNLEEMAKYTGVLRPRNFELVRDDLKAKGMLAQAKDFMVASGKLSVQLYKEEIEVLLRTPGHGGFQLLDLHDFPGQGTALIGVLDPFWDSKGLIEPAAFRRFCGPSVPLLRLKKRTFTSDETLIAQAEIAHYAAIGVADAQPVWSIKDAAGKELASGSLPRRDIATGKLTSLGEIAVPLSGMPAPAKLNIEVAIEGTSIANDWDIWVYPPSPATQPAGDILVSQAWDEPTRTAAAAGKKVLLLASARILNKSLPGSFTTVFWSPIWFNRGAGTMGILCDPKHPALASFPTESYTSWQWHDPLERSRTVVLDEMPAELRPIVQVIDNFSRNHRLGNLFEAKVGSGRLLVCSIDLQNGLEKRPAARQLLASLLAYMDSDKFQPAVSLEADVLDRLFHPPLSLTTSTEEPPGLADAHLRVKAAVHVTKDKAERWRSKADEVLRREAGFDYTVKGSTWRDATGSSWHDGERLVVTVKCPKGFSGRLHAFMHDWNSLQRVAEVYFQERSYGQLDQYDGPGVWISFEVTPADSAKGELVIALVPTNNNAMISQISLTK